MDTKWTLTVLLLVATCVNARPSLEDALRQRYVRDTSQGGNTQLYGVPVERLEYYGGARGSVASGEGLEYYGGASGSVLTYHPVLGLIQQAAPKEEENVGEEPDPPIPPANDATDTITVSKPPPGASVAEAAPIGIAIAGVGGVAASKPVGTAIVGPGGLAISRPVATAIAGVDLADGALLGAGAMPDDNASYAVRAGSADVPQAVDASPGPLGPPGPLRGYQYGSYRPDTPHSELPISLHPEFPIGLQPSAPVVQYGSIYGNPQGLHDASVLVNPGHLQGVTTLYQSVPALPLGLHFLPHTYNVQPLTKQASNGPVSLQDYENQPIGAESTVAVGPNMVGDKYSILPILRSQGQPVQLVYQPLVQY